MISIIRGTTPTIKYTFRIVNPSDIVTAVLTIKSRGTIAITKTLEDAIVGETDLSWTLTQEETLSLTAGQARMMLNWVTSGGTRGASAETAINVEQNQVKEVL